MAGIGGLLRNRRAGAAKLLWNRSELQANEDLGLVSPDFEHNGSMPVDTVSTRVGGRNLSPALSWRRAPAEASALLLVIADIDVPLPAPITHAAALLDPALTELPRGGLNSANPAEGVRLLRGTLGAGYQGPAPIKGHGPHRYVVQLFAVSGPTPSTQGSLNRIVASVDRALARGRVDGVYERS